MEVGHHEKKRILALIPSRLKSKRLPAKAILPIKKIPMVIHVYQRALLSKKFMMCLFAHAIKKF